LQIQDIETLLLFRFFIRDIERQLQKHKCTSPIREYCGRIMSNEDIRVLKDNVGSCMIINSLLATSIKEQIRTYFSQIELSNDLQRVLFTIDADPDLENIKPFSNISSLSYHPNEERTLFMLGSIFRIVDVRQEHEGILNVRLTLCSENEPNIKSIFDREQMTDELSFGQIFGELRQFNTAEIYYKHLLKGLPSEHEDMISCYDALGNLEQQKGDYDSSLEYCNQALDMRMKIMEVNDPNIGDGYNNIGEIYRKKKDFKRALDSFNKAIEIYSKKYNNDHPKIATCFNNIGHLHMDDNKYSKALEYYEKALRIRKKCFQDTDIELADSYRNIGNAFENQKDFDHALDNYQRSLRIYEKSSVPPYFAIGMTFKSIANIYETKKQYQEARSHYEKAFTSFQNVLSEDDNQIIQIQKDIQRVSVKSK
jgi:tetratricopeptide (TPR) repeat protein